VTEALQKLVEAMATEIAEQAILRIPVREQDGISEVDITSLNLEKVARAGLEAIRFLPDEVKVAGGQCEPFLTPPGQSFTPGQIVAVSCWRAMLAEILKD
jgi:hypothetical protein